MAYIGNAPAAGILSGDNIQDGTVGTNDLANSAVTTAKIADGGVHTAKIADNAVSAAKLHTTAVTDKLGYTPLNKAGDTMTGALNMGGNLINLGANRAFADNMWAGGTGFPGYVFTGGNSRFGFSSTEGVVDVYTDGDFYANQGVNKVWNTGNYPEPWASGEITGAYSAGSYSPFYTHTSGVGTFLCVVHVASFLGGGENYGMNYSLLFATGEVGTNNGIGEVLPYVRGGHAPNGESWTFKWQHRFGGNGGTSQLQWTSTNSLTLDGGSGRRAIWKVWRLVAYP